jgi:uncharacterized UBP type Zn finger protein
MTFNKIQLLRNQPIQVERENPGTHLFVQPPTISQLYDDNLYFFTIQLLTVEIESLKNILKVKNKKLSRVEIINIILEEADENQEILKHLQKIILGCYFDQNFLCLNEKEITETEINKISKLLKISIGEQKYEDYSEEEKTMTDDEKRLLQLEEKIKKKKQAQEDPGKEVDSKSILEDIIIAVTYEFGFTLEHIMNMNYFALL